MTAIAPAVFISVPRKCVAIKPNEFPKLQPVTKPDLNEDHVELARSVSPTSSGYASSECAMPKGKKRRLDHLTWEEKLQRKKLKNRVAAQTSRDRKKARMEDMDHEIKELTEKTEMLNNKCESLISLNASLFEKNRKLDIEVEQLRQQLHEIKQTKQSESAIVTCASCASMALNGSAVSKYTNPLQQGLEKGHQDTQFPQASTQAPQQIAALWKIVALCLLYKTCSSSMTSQTSMKKILTPVGWRSWQKACLPISQQTWKLAIERAMRLLPKLQASQSDCLDQWWGPQQNAWNPTDTRNQQLMQQQQQQQKVAT